MDFKILVIDDDSGQRKLCKDAIDLFNKVNGCKLEIIEAIDREEGFSRLKESECDAAIIDLRLEKNNETAQGNDILREIKNNLRIPVRVVSGFLGDLNEDLKEESYFYKCFSRDDVDYVQNSGLFTIQVLQEF